MAQVITPRSHISHVLVGACCRICASRLSAEGVCGCARDVGWDKDDVWFRALLHAGQGRDAAVCQLRHWHCALPVKQYAPGLGHRSSG